MSNMELEDQEFLKELLSEFQEEASQRLTKLENLLISFSPGKEEIGTEIKRELHTLKGSSAMLGLDVFSKLSHKLEDLFKQGEEKGVFPKSFLAFLLDGITLMKNYLQDPSVQTALSDFLKKAEDYEIKEEEPEKEREEEKDTADLSIYNQPKFITIDAEKIDAFLNFIGEFIFREEEIIAQKGNIKKVSRVIKKLFKREDGEDLVEEAEKTFHFLIDYVNSSKIYVEELKNYMYVLRTQPLSTVFDALPAQVFKISQTLGKKIDFSIQGREIQLDRRIISQLGEPLMHMIRNAIDHGIEDPEERKKKGKKEEGKITLSARYEGDNIFIELKDDGRGIDIEKIKERALKRNLITEEELKGLSEQGIMNLIFIPGFSTKSGVTMLSGRGIGMDIVKNKVLALGGEIYIDSKKDEYTKITLRLPTTLGISRILFLRIKEFVFGVFSFHVKGIFKSDVYEEVILSDERFLKIDTMLIPIIDMGKAFLKEGSKEYYVQFFINGQYFILPIDEVLDEKEVVVRPFSNYLRRKIKLFNSFAILQEGKIAPLLEAQTIFNYRTIYKDRFAEPEKKVFAESSPKILLVEDAPVTRKMEAMILRDEGFSVYEASNGKEGLEIYRREPEFSMIITDLEMPIMDGGELIKVIRKEDRDIPIVVVTTLSEREINREIFDLTELIVPKREFARGEFIQKIKAIIERKNDKNNRRD